MFACLQADRAERMPRGKRKTVKRCISVVISWGRGHDGLVNCVRTAMSKSVSITKTCVAAKAIYSHNFAGHDALASAFVAACEDSPVVFSLVGISRNRQNL